MNRRVAVRAIIVKDGKLLAMKAKPYAPGVNTNIWFTVGGTLEDDESLLEGLAREVIEETGVTPVIGDLLFIHQFKTPNREHMEFLFHVTNAEDFVNPDLSKSTHAAIEIETLEFIEAAQVDLFPAFLREESFDDLSVQPPKFFSYL